MQGGVHRHTSITSKNVTKIEKKEKIVCFELGWGMFGLCFSIVCAFYLLLVSECPVVHTMVCMLPIEAWLFRVNLGTRSDECINQVEDGLTVADICTVCTIIIMLRTLMGSNIIVFEDSTELTIALTIDTANVDE